MPFASFRWAAAVAAAASLQSCPTLCDLIDGGPPGFPVPGILQARTLVDIAFSRWAKTSKSNGTTVAEVRSDRDSHPFPCGQSDTLGRLKIGISHAWQS